MIPDRLDPARQPWMKGGGLTIIQALAAAGAEARFVGGCVRDALLGQPVGDIDLAVNVPPDRVVQILQTAGIKCVPTGLDHGTITAVLDGKGYEITSLREDMATDGRHAEVRFTTDWQADASRRDFTMNALYLGADGQLTDFFHGRADIEARLVRFIGDAEQRIREDYLRILRFFRFYAWFGMGDADAVSLKACVSLAANLDRLSYERIWKEISKTLRAANPLGAWRLMLSHNILAKILDDAQNADRLQRLLGLGQPRNPVALVRLAALLPENAVIVSEVAARLKMSKREQETLKALASLPAQLRNQLEPKSLRRALYEHDPDFVHDALLLMMAAGEDFNYLSVMQVVEKWESPVLPVQGVDLLRLGVPAGPRVGEILRLVEAWWIAADFRPDREECLHAAETLAKAA